MPSLNLGAGNKRLKPGYLHLDSNPRTRPDIVARVPPIPVRDGSLDAIYSSHLLEHLTTGEAACLMAEIWRVLKPYGEAEFIVPYALSRGAFQDLTHRTFWTPETFLYFTPHYRDLDYGWESRFQLREWSCDGSEVRTVLVKAPLSDHCYCPVCLGRGVA